MTLVVFAFALNLSSRIKTYGAYAGIAAIIGLAVLSVLYFAQAREIKRLRAWAGRGPERAAEQSARVSAEAEKRVVAEPAARPQPATAAAQSAPPPAGVGPVTAAATATATATEGELQEAKVNGDVAPDETQLVNPDAELPASAEAPAETEAGAEAPAAEPPPETTAGDNGNGEPSDEAAADVVAAPAAAAEDARQTSVAMAPVPASARLRASATPRTPRTPAPPAGDDGDGGGHSSRRTWLLVGGGVLAVAIVAVVLAAALGGGSSSKSGAAHSTPTPSIVTSTGPHRKVSTKSTPPRSSIVVGVLNGTTFNGLAKQVGQQLAGSGYNVDTGSERNAVDQTHAATLVAYASGQYAAGLAVAKTLGLGSDALVSLDAGTNQLVGGGKTVVVTVGADLSH